LPTKAHLVRACSTKLRYNTTMENSSNAPRNFKKPKDIRIFQNSSENWLAFRKIRFASAGDGEYATIKGLDLSNGHLNNFPVDHLVFIECNLNDASFKNTEFRFNTTFINCTMKGADLSHTLAAGMLFMDCDLSGIKISPKSPYARWTSMDLDNKVITSVFSGCIIDDSTKKFLLENDCLLNESRLTQDERLLLSHKITEKIDRINAAPVLDL
jgi:uncharacterized protein YjbI with pentapeptide repeats